MKAAIGIVTYNRPEFAEKCTKAIAAKLPGVVEGVYMYNDGSDSLHNGAYERAYRPLKPMDATIVKASTNRGVAYAKNRLLEMMLEDTNADYLFLIEDDIRILNPRCIRTYMRVADEHGLHHLSFAHHGPGNIGGPVAVDGEVAYYQHSIGAFTMFSRECLIGAGLFDENLYNAWEHVEHELRLMQLGYMPGCSAGRYPDVLGSEHWLRELPNAIERSSIRPRPDWDANIRQGLRYWRDAKPETYDILFGSGTALEQYALHLIG